MQQQILLPRRHPTSRAKWTPTMKAVIKFGKNSFGFLHYREGHLHLVPERIEISGWTLRHRSLPVRVIPDLVC